VLARAVAVGRAWGGVVWCVRQGEWWESSECKNARKGVVVGERSPYSRWAVRWEGRKLPVGSQEGQVGHRAVHKPFKGGGSCPGQVKVGAGWAASGGGGSVGQVHGGGDAGHACCQALGPARLLVPSGGTEGLLRQSGRRQYR